MCGLEQFADAIVGSLGVEQKKRTTIGVELAAKVRLSDPVVSVGLLRVFSLNFFFSLMSPLRA
jgi:hypothetical protein